MIVRADDAPTTVMPRIDGERPTPGTLRSLAPWAAFGLVAVLVVGGAVAWSASLRGPQQSTASLAQASAPPSSVAPASPAPVAAPVAQTQAPAPTARRTVPRSVPRPSRVAVTPVAPVVPAAPTVAATTTTATPKPVATDPFGPAFTPGCTGPTAATDPACQQAGPNAANPPGTGPATGR